MPKKNAKYDEPVARTKKSHRARAVRGFDDKIERKVKAAVIEKNLPDLLMPSKSEKARAEAAKKARGGKPPLSSGAMGVLLGRNTPKAKPKKKKPSKTYHYEYK